MLEHTYISPRAGSYLVWLVNPFQGTSLAINIICNLQGVCTLLLGYGQDGVRLLLLNIIPQAGLQCESILFQAESCNPQLLSQVVPAVKLAIRTRKEKTTPFGVNLTRSLVIYQAAQICHQEQCRRQHIAAEGKARTWLSCGS